MQLSAVAFVLAETILREPGAKFTHHHIARDFRDHTRGRDAKAEAVAVDNRGLREWEWKYRQAVDERVIRLRVHAGDRDPHRLVGRT